MPCSLKSDTICKNEVLGVETATDGPLVDLKAASMSGGNRIVPA